MKSNFSSRILTAALGSILALGLAACNGAKADPNAEAPPKAVVEPDLDANNFRVDHPEQFPLVTAVEHKAMSALNVTGVVQPDITRAVPVISLAAGRVVEIKARLGDVSQRPFAIVIVGGLIADLVMSIFLLPTLYVWVARERDVLPSADGAFEQGEHIV